MQPAAHAETPDIMIAIAELILNGLVSGLVIGLAALAITLVFGIARSPMRPPGRR